MERHERFLRLRDKHVAHAANDHEQITVWLDLAASSFEPRRVENVGQMHTEALAMDAADALSLAGLCAVQLADVNRRMVDIQNRISREIDAMGLDALYALPDLAVRPGV